MKRKKMITAAICICILSVLVITASAVVKYKYTSASGNDVSKTINRVNIEVKNTEFTFDSPDSNGTLYCTSTVSIEKTEPDFYGMIDSITLDGQEFESIIYTAGKNNGNTTLPQNALLPVKDGKPIPLTWEISYSVPYIDGQNTYNMNIEINYTTGVKANVKQSYKMSVPITITVK